TLYVGKAKSLRKRVASYLARELEPRLAGMLAEAVDVDFVTATSEREALLLENNFIKERKPRYNVLLRDDKTYPYLKLTAEPWPRVVFTRRIRDDGAEYFGPYLPGGLARRAVKLVQKLFGVRVCRIDVDGSLARPCLYWDTKRCLGPCVAGLTTAAEYATAVEGARLFLAGRIEPLARRLRAEMDSAAAGLEFERAARLRDLLREVEPQRERANLASVGGEDVDLFGVVVRGRQAAISILVMRGGQVLDRRELFWEGEGSPSAETLLAELLPQIYERTTFLPKEIHLPVAIEGDESLADWLGERKGERVYLRYPARGPKAQRLAAAAKDAEFAFRRRFRTREDGESRAVQDLLSLPEPPRWIEGFDISNTHGQQSVASIVVWREGRLRKGEYRSLNLRGLDGPDDFRSIEQAVERRYRRLLEETGELPDLVLVDGGRGQLNAALTALGRLGLEEMQVAGLAKREEELYLPGAPEPLRPSRHDAGLQLLQRIRDECHRFAVSRHRAQRSKRSLRSVLDEVRGIGPARRRALLQRFGSVDAVAAAPLAELSALVGAAAASRLKAALAPAGESPGGVPLA
ncbi:MAG: excinuclease ABC subunit UvrC, partial [Thermoanaerobaculia bacterium]|nr:excinuclease ABC subunit UvrC [Thermoanaerobaculia bacterium]